MKNKDIFIRFFRYSKNYKKDIFIGLILLSISTIASLIGPYISGKIINEVVVSNFYYKTLVILVSFFALSLIIQAITSYLLSVKFEKITGKISRDIRRDLYNHVENLPIKYYDNLPAGKVTARITSDTKQMKEMFSAIFTRMISPAFQALGYFIACILIDWRIIFVFLILSPAMYWAYTDFIKKSFIFSTKSRSYISNMNATINEDIKNIEIIQAFNDSKYTYDDFQKINHNNYNYGIKMTKLFAYNAQNMTSVFTKVSTLLVIIIASRNYLNNIPMTIGSIYIIVNYMISFFQNLRQIMFVLSSVQRSLGSAVHVADLFDIEKEVDSNKQIESISGEVEFKNIRFAYDRDDVLKDVNFKIKKNSSLAFVGQTGSGKSTMMNLLMRFYDVERGEILIDGINIKDFSRNSLRSHISMVLQDAQLFNGTIFDNITMGKDISRQKAMKALKDVGGDIILKNHPKGLDTMIKDGGRGFSQGEKQIISFARAYVTDPEILILDEATANIDTQTESLIQQAVFEMSRDRTTIIIAHRLSTIHFCDQILVLDHGEIVERGDHNSLIEQKGRYYKMYQKESKGN
ncbi:MAG: ABC transporter ATP-binding protein [Tissierellia bacterium]|nr:ABC transporter ATP-binding protein [Tissierellia bacterium]